MPDEPKDGGTAGRALPQGKAVSSDLVAVVAMGASAGGLEAFQLFFDAMPQGHGFAFILVQHLEPSHPSLMVDLLADHTPMHVEEAQEDSPILPDHVYVIPPGTYLSVKAGKLHLSLPDARHGARLPFDFLLHSLAMAFGARVQVLVLSGSGADGSVGLLAINAQGGFVIAQKPDEAGFGGMPENAIATGKVDAVLGIAAMPQALLRRALHINSAAQNLKSEPATMPDADILKRIITLLRERTPHDFSAYKPGTLMRRMERRMLLAKYTSLERYFAFLENDAAECAALANDMLINVTAFFRDPKVFSRLEKTIIPELLAQRGPQDPVRVWIAGCSTGEEAYSIAILFQEAISASKRPIKLQVFASDIDPEAVTLAREGFYPESVMQSVSAARRKKFFSEEAQGYRILPELRGLIVFTVQDILTDPPFSRLDFVSCRNVLIYLNAEAQGIAIARLHFALLPGGILLLGSAETAGKIEGRFEVVAKNERIYRHISRTRPGAGLTFQSRAEALPQSLALKSSPRPPPRGGYAELCRQTMIESYAPAGILINAACDCLFSVGQTKDFITPSTGYPTHDLTQMLPFGLKNRLMASLKTISAGTLEIEGGVDRAGRDFTLAIHPLMQDAERLFLIVFLPVIEVAPLHGAQTLPETAGLSEAGLPEHAPRIATLKRQLALSRHELGDAIRMLDQTKEAQKAAHEEALSVNEEFQSANEELLTSKEELQSLNEELTALNNQLHEALERQRSTSNDLQNILYSTHVATLFLDLDLKIRYFTPATRALFHVLPGDIGRPLADLASLTEDGALLEEAEAVLTGLAPVEREVKTAKGVWFLRRILPYRADDDAVEGVVITFTDISDRKIIEKALETAKKQAETANTAKSRFLAAASHDLRQPLQSLTLIQGLLANSVENERGRQLVERLEQTLGAITGMMNTLLDINQIEAGTVDARLVHFPVRDLFERMKNEFLFVAQAQKLELRVIPSSLVIRSDPRLLEQMIRNLVSNALKYTRRGKVLLGCRRRAGGISIEVWDTGIGIEQGQHEAIFREYHQIDNDARERNRGRGLGLAIVQRLADLLGHHIGLRSRSGLGSVFAIEITLDPARVAAIDAVVPDVPPPASSKKGILLVVEDDPEVGELLDLHLTGAGHQVLYAKNGAAALALVAQSTTRPDLVLADYNLPDGMDGLALAKNLRALLGSLLPVIILTGDISAQTLRLIAKGGAAQLNKPVSTQDLSAKVQNMLEEAAQNTAIDGAAQDVAATNTILIIDDDAGIRDYLVASLREEGMAAIAFASSEVFLAQPQPVKAACLLLDAYLPGMDGLTLLRQMTTQRQAIPVIMMTGRSDVAIAVEAMKAGAVDFIEKPINTAGLFSSIRQALSGAKDASTWRGGREAALATLAKLTKRQREIMALVLSGQPNKNIAADLGISQRTVENHRAAIMEKTGSKSLPALARLAFMAGPA